MIAAVTRWLFFGWGCLTCAVMAYFALQWFPRASDPQANELAIGFMMGLFYGWPSWLALPAFAIFQRNALSSWKIALTLLPPTTAVAMYTVGRTLSAGGH